MRKAGDGVNKGDKKGDFKGQPDKKGDFKGQPDRSISGGKSTSSKGLNPNSKDKAGVYLKGLVRCSDSRVVDSFIRTRIPNESRGTLFENLAYVTPENTSEFSDKLTSLFGKRYIPLTCFNPMGKSGKPVSSDYSVRDCCVCDRTIRVKMDYQGTSYPLGFSKTQLKEKAHESKCELCMFVTAHYAQILALYCPAVEGNVIKDAVIGQDLNNKAYNLQMAINEIANREAVEGSADNADVYKRLRRHMEILLPKINATGVSELKRKYGENSLGIQVQQLMRILIISGGNPQNAREPEEGSKAKGDKK